MAVWVLKFLTGKRVLLHIKKRYMKVNPMLAKEITSLGMEGFIMQGTNCLVQVVCNATLKIYGGDLYVGIMTVINSVRDIVSLPVSGLTSGSQPVLGYNYGAREYTRVKQGICFTALLGILYTVAAWLFIIKKPRFLISVFTEDATMLEYGVSALHLYFFGFFFMAFQFTGQSTFTALGHSRQAIFFSLLRKAIIVTPLTILLPRIGFGVSGVFLAEPISNAIGGLAYFITMWFTVYRRLGRRKQMVMAKTMDGVAAVCGGANHTVIIRTDESVWTCGSGNYGELGNVTPVPYNSDGDVGSNFDITN